MTFIRTNARHDGFLYIGKSTSRTEVVRRRNMQSLERERGKMHRDVGLSSSWPSLLRLKSSPSV